MEKNKNIYKISKGIIFELLRRLFDIFLRIFISAFPCVNGAEEMKILPPGGYATTINQK